MRLMLLMPLCLAAASISQAAVSSLACSGTAAQAVIRAEGEAERLGDIVLQCQSAIGATDVVSAVQVVLSAPVVASPAAELTLERSGVVLQTLTGQVTGTNIISFPPLSATLDASGQATIRISNVRVDATAAKIGQQITAIIGTTGATGLGVVPNPLTPAVVEPGLLVNSTTAAILCTGSAAPSGDPLTLAGLFSAGTVFSTLRATEGSADAFQVKLGGATTGTRILVQFTGFPAGAHLYLPVAIAGSTATVPTSAGDLGLTRSPGQYTPGPTGSLLLSLVTGANANGSGGTTLYQPAPAGSGTVVLLDAREIPLANGSATAVFEVVDSNSTIIESAQIPVFVALAANSPGNGTVAQAQLELGPVSPATDVPRFTATQNPGLDCSVLHDCNASYFPHLSVEAPSLDYAAQLGAQVYLSKHIIVSNSGGGLMPWQVTWTYQSGTGWLNVVAPTGVNQAAFQLDANISAITAPGLYRATLVIDAGPLAGTVQLPVTFTVGGDATMPLISSAANSADSTVTTLVPGSRAALAGVRFPGQPTVTFNGIAANVISAATERVEVVVPESLAAAASANVVVSSGSLASPAFSATLAPAAPAIYPGAVFNQNNTGNALNAPEKPGNLVQTFLTGLPIATAGSVTAKITGDAGLTTPVTDIPYAGVAPGWTGVQQVNLRIPATLPTGNLQLLICGMATTTGTQTCSPPVRLYVNH